MSFSFSGLAANKAHAKAIVVTNAPRQLHELLCTAIDNMGHDGPMTVLGSGHLCEGPGSYEATTASIEIKPVALPSRVMGAEKAIDTRDAVRRA